MNHTEFGTFGFQFLRSQSPPLTDLTILTSHNHIRHVYPTLHGPITPPATYFHHGQIPNALHSVVSLAGPNSRPCPILPSLTPIAVFTISMSHYELPPCPRKLISITDEYRMQHIRSSVLGVKIPAHTQSLHPHPPPLHLPLIPHP